MAKADFKKCKYCGQDLNIKKEEYEYINRRYAHKKCHEEFLKKEEQKEADQKIIERINGKMYQLLGVNCNYAMIRKQITNLQNKGRTPQGILATLEYWYDVKKNDTSKANGAIGIVDFVYDEAQRYWANLERAKEKGNNIAEETIKNIQEPEVVRYNVRTKPFRKPKNLKLFELK